MKKLLFSLAFIAATLTSCLTDKPGLNYEGKDSVNFSIGINVPELATRAGETGMNSGLGAIDNFSADEWAEYDLRYMLEVYDVSEGYENLNTPVKQRMVQTFDEYQETTFELRLIPNRTYKFVVWADFVLQGTEEDLNYNTANLKEITRTGYVSPMDECMDAYFVQKDIEVTTTLSSTLTLTRPFGKIRVIATDAHEVNIGSTPSKVDVTFYNHPTFFSLNALSGAVETEVDTVTYSYDITKEAPYTEGYDAEACNQTLFADYIFADTDAQETNFVLTVWGEDGRVIREHDFNTQIPLKRNHLTTIMGNLLTTATEFNVSIDDNFDGETPINYNPDAITLATPEVYTSVEENVVTLYWNAVENADYYVVACGDNTESTTETSITFTLDYDTEYAFEVSAYSNDTFNYNASEAAVVYITIENIATCIEFTYAEVSPNYNQGWTDFNIDFYNENASCVASFNLWNICQSNFIPEGEYYIALSSPCIYPEGFSHITLNGTKYNLVADVGSVTVSEVNGLYEITMDNIKLINGPEFNGKFTGSINGMIVPSEANNGGDNEENEENNGYKVYATTELGWEYMDIWLWNDAGNLTTNPYWPGDAMGKEVVDGVEYFVYTLPENVSMYSIVLSTDWGNVQTVDYTNIIADRDRFFRVINTTDNAGHYYIEEITFGGNEGDDEGENFEFTIPGEGGTYAMDYRYTTLVSGLDANNSIRVAQDNGWTWDIKFNSGLSEIVAGDYKATGSSFTSADALEVDCYNGGFQNKPFNYVYPDEYDKVTTFNVQKEGDYYCITMIGSGGYGNDVGSFRCVYIGKIVD